jgi:hypothetical protein
MNDDPVTRLEHDFKVDRGAEILMGAAERKWLEAKAKALVSFTSTLASVAFVGCMVGVAFSAWFMATR